MTLPGLVEWKPSGIPSAAILRSQSFSQFQAFLLRQASVGPRSSGEVARQHASARSNQRFVNSFLCLNLFFAERQSYIHICGFNAVACSGVLDVLFVKGKNIESFLYDTFLHRRDVTITL